MGNRLINFGIRAGGVSYVWDDWSAYSSVSSGTTVTVGDPVEGAQEIQVQTRTRTGYTYNQLQTRTRTCSCSSFTGMHRNDVYAQFVSESGSCVMRIAYWCPTDPLGRTGVAWNYGCDPWCTPTSCSGHIRDECETRSYSISECQIQYESGWYPSSCSSATYSCPSGYTGLYQVQCQNMTSTTCNWGSWTGWSNTGSCSTTYPGCSNGAVQRECRTVTLCAWNAYSAWTDVASCTAATPACTNGALERNCQQRTRNAIEG